MADLPSKRSERGRKIAAAEKMNRVKALNKARRDRWPTLQEMADQMRQDAGSRNFTVTVRGY